MRAVVVLLLIAGVVFMAMLLMGGGDSDPGRAQRIKDGEEDPPSWTTWFDAPFGSFAPRVKRFVSGGPVTRIASGNDVEQQLPSDADNESRIATFQLVEGDAVRLVYQCQIGPAGPCRTPEAVTLCLGRPGAPRHDDCQKGRIKPEGSFEVGSGGGRVTFIADGAQETVVVLRD